MARERKLHVAWYVLDSSAQQNRAQSCIESQQYAPPPGVRGRPAQNASFLRAFRGGGDCVGDRAGGSGGTLVLRKTSFCARKTARVWRFTLCRELDASVYRRIETTKL